MRSNTIAIFTEDFVVAEAKGTKESEIRLVTLPVY